MLNDSETPANRAARALGQGYSRAAMAKEKTSFTCTECGGVTPRWLGKCPHCEAWNTLIEGVAEPGAPARNRFASLAP